MAEEDYKGLGIQTDYRKQSREVFIHVAQRMIASGEMDILSLCRLPDSSTSGSVPKSLEQSSNRRELPSWTPDWTEQIAEPHAWFINLQNSLFSASGNTTSRASFQNGEGSANPRSVILTGLLVDKVSQVGRATHYRARDWDNLADTTQLFSQATEIRNLCKVSQKLGHNIYTAFQLHEAPWRLPIWDHECLDDLKFRRATGLSEARYTLLRWFSHQDMDGEQSNLGLLGTRWQWSRISWHQIRFCGFAMCVLPVLCARLFLADKKASLDPVNEMKYYLQTATSGHATRPIITKRGYIGYGPSSARPGDLVCIFLGARVPHILRKRGEGQPGYVLVGDAFVYGAMDGELIKEDQDYVDFKVF